VTRQQWAGRVCRLAAAAALLAVSMSPALGSATAATSATRGTPAATATSPAGTTAVTEPVTDPVTISLGSVTPTTAKPRVPVTIIGTVHNAGQVSISSPVARAHIGGRPLTSRAAVSGWAESTDEQPAREVARTSLGKTLTPGAVAIFALTIPATAISHRESFAVLPLLVDLTGSISAESSLPAVLGSHRTFLPTLSSQKRYVPLPIAWLAPLTLDPDPALHGVDSAARTAAWIRAIGPGSRLDRLISGTDTTEVTWAIDPAILGPPPTVDPLVLSTAPNPTPSAPSAPLPGIPTPPDPVTEATTALANRLKAAAPRHPLWALPYADPDFAALLPLSPGASALAELVGHPSTVDVAVGPARADIAWPVDGAWTAEHEAQLRPAFSAEGLAAGVVSTATLTSASGPTGDASRKSSGGLALLAYDEVLSRTFAQMSSTASGATTIQRFLADSMALLGERPGTPNRSVLVAAPRTFDPDPAVLGSFFAAIVDSPWLTPTTTGQLLTESGAAASEVPADGTTASGSATAPTAAEQVPDPLRPGISPLTPAKLEAVPGTLSAITGIASIRDDARPFQVRWTDAQEQLVSVRWRAHPGGHAAVIAATQAAIAEVSRGVRVAPSSVNFFADRGALQVTVVNDLAVAVHDVRLSLSPAQPRLRIEQQPPPLKIGAKSRTNVRLDVTAIAAGLVPIEAVLTTPNGTPLGQNARVNVRVQPTSTWIYWVLVSLAGAALVLGTHRSVGRGSTRSSRPAAAAPPFDD
jgi:Family of unknown function (DUF6049)